MTDASMTYRVHPVVRQPWLVLLGLLLLAVALLVCYWLVPQPWVIALLGLAMLWQLAPGLLPQTANLSEQEISVTCAWRTRRIAYEDILRLEPVRLGVWLYRDAQPNVHSKRKGLFLLIPEDRRDEVMQYVRSHAQNLLG